jgi:small nuclear ribonucleoprotein (snRNP)-like protein
MVMDNKKIIGTLEGCVNWMSAILVLIEETDCNPDDPERFDEILIATTLMMGQAENLISELKREKL